MSPLDRARAYVANCPPAISGHAGHDQTYTVACALVHGFGLPYGDAYYVLSDYNQTCQPPWSEKDLRHKIETAIASTKHEKPRGHLLGGSVAFQFTRGGYTPTLAPKSLPQAKPVTPRGAYKADSGAKLPEPIADPTRKLIEAAFNAGECVCIAQETIGEDGRGVPKDSGATLAREDWLSKLRAVGGNPNQIWSSTERTGAYIRVNPLKPGGSRDNEVTAFRHVLLEFDKSSVAEQWSIIQQSNVPCTAVLHSGNRSLHAWVRVDARDDSEYRDRVKFLFEHFHEFQPDEKNKNPSRLSRLPGMIRGSGRQELLALKIGARRGDELSWDEWVSTEGEGLPRIRNWIDIIRDMKSGALPEPPQVINGILHKGHKLVLGGGSKTNKSWCLIDLALSVAGGGQWMQTPCNQGDVLYLNFEIDEWHFGYRLRRVAESKNMDPSNDGIAEAMKDALTVWSLRGHTSPYGEMIPAIKKHTKGRQYALIILDPLYKLMGNADENKATDINQLLNAIESLAQHTGAATAFGAHFSKGNQAGKESIDRISGSGVFARDPDAIIMITAHETKEHFVIDTTLRNFAPIDPFVVKWDWKTVLLTRDKTGLDPAKLKQPEANQRKHDPLVLLSAIRTTTSETPITVTAWADLAGIKRPTMNGYLDEMRKKGWIQTVGEGTKAKKYITEAGLRALDGKIGDDLY